MDKSKLAALGERLVSGGAQMGRKVSGKMKELLQVQTPESKMVDEATSDSMSEPNWGINLRICALLNAEEFSGPEVMKAIGKKISGKNMACQRFSLDLLEACAMNCEKVFSEIASEKVLEEMVTMIENPQTHFSNRQRALQLIQAWGESPDLGYLPVFSQTYLNLKTRGVQFSSQDAEILDPTIKSASGQHHLDPPEGYPNIIVDQGSSEEIPLAYYAGLNFSVEEKKEALVVARNSIELFTSLTDHETHSTPVKDELISSMLEKCKQSQSIVQRIIESTVDDDALLFEALNVHEELQQVLLKFEKVETAPETTPTDERQGVENTAVAAAGSSLNDSSGLYSETSDPHGGTNKDQKSPRAKE